MTLPFHLDTKSSKLLVIDDDLGFLSMFKWAAKQRWPETSLSTASTTEEAISKLHDTSPDVVVLDLGLPPDPDNASEGLRILRHIYENAALFPHISVVAYSGTVRQEHAIECARYGAHFISKSGDQATLFAFIDLMFNNAALRKACHHQQDHENPHPLLVGSCELLRNAIRKTERVAATDISVLMLGESGTGKEVFAKLLHESSGRKGAFVALNCAAIPEDLLENELFGHEKGAFTGASTLKKGKVELAHGGTLFLDEIGDMPLSLQSKILRFLEEGTVDRVGGSAPIPVDVRVVCATHRDLKKMISLTKFRSDLYYRLAKMTIELPPLRERGQDVITLAHYFLKESCEQYPTFLVDGFSESAIIAMQHHKWPGNIRELRNRIQSAIVCAEKSLITAGDLQLKTPSLRVVESSTDDLDAETCEFGRLSDVVAEFERKLILRALRVGKESVAEAARLLQVPRSTLYSKFRDYNIRTKSTEAEPA